MEGELTATMPATKLFLHFSSKRNLKIFDINDEALYGSV